MKQALEWMGVEVPDYWKPRYNIAPTQRVLVLNGERRIEEMHWGIVPRWAKESPKALINARSESVREKRSFKAGIEKRRCLLPADGFYEWSKAGKKPHYFTIEGDKPFAIAAIWEPDEEQSRCCLLTTEANAILEPIHNRMPVIIEPRDWEEWFSPQPLPEESYQRLTAPYSPREMREIEVSPIVNSARIDDARCCEPATGGEPVKLAITKTKPSADEGQAMLDL